MCHDMAGSLRVKPPHSVLARHPSTGVGSGRLHHLPGLEGQKKSVTSSLNPSHPKTTSRAFVPRRRTTSAVAPMTYAQHTRPYERIPERQSSWGGGLPAGVNPPTASPSMNTCLMHKDRSDGMPTTKVPRTSSGAAFPPTEATAFRSWTTKDEISFACGANQGSPPCGCSAGWSLRGGPLQDARHGLVLSSGRIGPSGRCRR